MIIVGNSIVLTAVYTIRHKKSRVNFFVTHLALAGKKNKDSNSLMTS